MNPPTVRPPRSPKRSAGRSPREPQPATPDPHRAELPAGAGAVEMRPAPHRGAAREAEPLAGEPHYRVVYPCTRGEE